MTERSSGRQVTVFNLDPALRGLFDVLWDNSQPDTIYKASIFASTSGWPTLDAPGQREPGQKRGDTFASGELNNPNSQYRKEPSAWICPGC